MSKRNKPVQTPPPVDTTGAVTTEETPLEEQASETTEETPAEVGTSAIVEEEIVTEVAEEQAPSQTIVEAKAEVKSNPLPLSLGVITTSVITKDAPPPVDTSLVKVLIKYPEDYAGKKYMQDGKVYETSKAGANEFVSKGIGTIVT